MLSDIVRFPEGKIVVASILVLTAKVLGAFGRRLLICLRKRIKQGDMRLMNWQMLQQSLHNHTREILGHELFRVMRPRPADSLEGGLVLQVGNHRLEGHPSLAEDLKEKGFHILGERSVGQSRLFTVVPSASPGILKK